ncbi:Hint domain-containing protein [Roseovarius ramblicola]|uniref:Hint domain-containing protein n=1 Tax=Roseovarius ramblicola TaxID=2022336 RepID=A0ABV5HYF6_9RHOB
MAVITITSAGTYTVNAGDTFIIGPGVEGDVRFEAADGASSPVDFNIELNDSPTHDKDIKIDIKGHNDLHPNISIADGYIGHETEFDLKDASGSAITTGDDVIIGKLEASEDGRDVTMIGTLDRDELEKLEKLEFDGNGGHDNVIPTDGISLDLGWMTDAERAAFEQEVLDAGYVADGSGGFFAPDPDGDGKSDVGHIDFKMDLDGDGSDDFELKLHHYEQIGITSGSGVPVGIDGIVDGDNTANEIDLAYTGDPEDDRIDNNDAPDGSDDDVVDAGGGDDTVRSGEGNDIVYGGSGNDSVDGEAGDDVIFGDSKAPDGTFDGGAVVRESFEWDKAPASGDDDDDSGDGVVDNGDPLSDFTQNTGNVDVSFRVTSESSPAISHTFSDQTQFVGGIDSGDESIDDESGLLSDLSGTSNGQTGYELGFSAPVEDVDFRINDIDGSGTVTVRAFDADDNEIAVTLTPGSELDTVDANTVTTADVGTFDDTDEPDFSVHVQIDGPVSRIEIDHSEGSANSGIWVSDVYFDAPLADTGGAGDDTLLGGDGDDAIFGEGGDDSLIGGADDDSIDGGSGNDTISGDAAVGPVRITIDQTSAGFTNEVFAYTIDRETGEISNIRTLTANATDSVGETFTYSAAPGAEVGVGIVSPEGTFLSSGYGDNVGLNSDGLVHTSGIAQGGDGEVTLGFEDRAGLGDGDFNDVVVTVDPGSSGTGFDNAHFEAVSDLPETAEDGDDVIDGGTGDDLIHGLGGDDDITGGNGGDTIFGGSGSDTVDGGAGGDFIDTGTPLSGAPLPDLGFPGLFPPDPTPDDDRDLVSGGDGNDTILTGDDADTIDGGAGADSINAGIDADAVAGGAGDDTIIGGEGSDTIEGNDGDDLIYGGLDPSFPDSLNIPDDNPSGPDDPVPDNGRDLIFGGDGNDTIFGQDDDDTIHGGDGADSIDAGIDDDEVFGGADADTIQGGDGNDTITGGAGADSLSGGDDRDTFIVGSVADADGDIVDGGSGGDDFDTLDLSGLGPFVTVGETTDPDGNSTSGTINFLDSPGGSVTGTLSYSEIENIVPCFTPGTRIATPRGEVAVEDLRTGDRVITRDNGLQEIRWTGARVLGTADLIAAPHLRPVLIRAGALGRGLPERDMTVSPQHRLLLTSERAALYFGEREVLAAARHLTGMEGIDEIRATGTTYIHFMCDRHEVVLSDGAWTESFQPGEQVLDAMGDATREEIFTLFPELRESAGIEAYQAARRSLKRHEARLLVE